MLAENPPPGFPQLDPVAPSPSEVAQLEREMRAIREGTLCGDNSVEGGDK